MELSCKGKKKRLDVKFGDVFKDISTKDYIQYNLWYVLFFIIPISCLIYLSAIRPERREFDEKYNTEETKEYIILNKEQLIHDKSSTDLVFLIRCVETGKVFDTDVVRELYLSKNKGDHVWFSFPRHRFTMSEKEWNSINPPGMAAWIILVVCCFIAGGFGLYILMDGEDIRPEIIKDLKSYYSRWGRPSKTVAELERLELYKVVVKSVTGLKILTVIGLIIWAILI